ncbi:MAG: ferritin-like domain-containing protein [Chitinophagales bacterium]|nr:ferritin-like domain-containing protein [Chitinophagales bacterium]
MTNKIKNTMGEQELTDTIYKSMTSRRSFLKKTALVGGLGLGMGTFRGLSAFASPNEGPGMTAGDVAILSFLAAGELIETELWVQYCELAAGNKAYAKALNLIEAEMVPYVCDVTDDEQSHAKFINAYLVANGHPEISLDKFRTLPSSKATGAKDIGRLTNLMEVTVDTTWFNRQRDTGNPDFGTIYPQSVDIVGKPVIPLSDNVSEKEMQLIANCAAFHFAATEQNGASIYPSMIPKASNLEVLQILTSIGPTEAYFFASFHQSLEGVQAISGDGLVFPDMKKNHIGGHHFPRPCKFLREGLPLVTVIRPTATVNGGAMHLVKGLIKSNVFKGQSQEFLDYMTKLATAADDATRTL